MVGYWDSDSMLCCQVPPHSDQEFASRVSSRRVRCDSYSLHMLADGRVAGDVDELVQLRAFKAYVDALKQANGSVGGKEVTHKSSMF